MKTCTVCDKELTDRGFFIIVGAFPDYFCEDHVLDAMKLLEKEYNARNKESGPTTNNS